MKPYFSIIMPTYNRGYTIWKTIMGLQKQTCSNWELLVVDDGSDDNTQFVVAEFQRDHRVNYFGLKHAGGQFARNFGLKMVKGDVSERIYNAETKTYP